MWPLYGKLGDLIGRKSLFIGALATFVAGSVIGVLTNSMTFLIVGRAVQGLGGGLMLLSQAIIADVVPVRERGKYMGVMGAVFGISSVAGPILGGWFTESIGWRWAFGLNIPLGILAIILAIVFLPRRTERPSFRFDTWGTLTMAVAVTTFILAVSWGGNTYAWRSTTIVGLFLATAMASALFVLAESRAADPIIPLHLFRSRNFVLATLGSMAIAIAMFGAVGYMPTYLQMVTGYSATGSGLLLISMVAGIMLTSMGTGAIASRTGRYKWMPIASTMVTALGLVLLSTMKVSTSITTICAFLFVLGAGVGMGMQILVLVVQNALPASEVGTATASNNFFREIGATLGSAIVGSLFTSHLKDSLQTALAGSQGTGAAVSEQSLTPEIVNQLPTAVHDLIVSAYNEALAPIFIYLVPLMFVAFLAVVFIREDKLATSIEASGSSDRDSSASHRVDSNDVAAHRSASHLASTGDSLEEEYAQELGDEDVVTTRRQPRSALGAASERRSRPWSRSARLRLSW